MLLYLHQEGRGIGLANKLRAYELQDQGLDTVEANERLGFKPDQRDYGIGAQILRDLGVRTMRLLTNNPRKFVGLEGYGLSVAESLPLEVTPVVETTRKYLRDEEGQAGTQAEVGLRSGPKASRSRLSGLAITKLAETRINSVARNLLDGSWGTHASSQCVQRKAHHRNCLRYFDFRVDRGTRPSAVPLRTTRPRTRTPIRVTRSMRAALAAHRTLRPISSRTTSLPR